MKQTATHPDWINNPNQIAPPLIDLDGESYSVTYQLEQAPQTLLLGEAESVQADFDPKTTKADRLDYALAAASGLLSSVVDIFTTPDFSLSRSEQLGKEDAMKFVLKFARSRGFQGDDLTKAIRFLERFGMPGDLATAAMGGGKQHHLRDFTHHPTPVGLFFSILAQFTGVVYGTRTDGSFFGEKIDPTAGVIGENFLQKIAMGTLQWLTHLASDLDGSSNNPGAGTGIPGPLLSVLKELSATPLFTDLRSHGNEGVKQFTVWLSKLFNGTAFKDSTGQPIRFDLRTEMGVTKLLSKQARPVILNEVLVRMAYSVRRLTAVITASEVRTLHDLMQLDPQAFLPFNNRVISRMLVVSTGVFSAIDLSQAAIAAHFGEKPFKGAFIAKVNIVGLGRFAVAFHRDSHYIYQDVQGMYAKYQEHVSVIHRPYLEVPFLAQASLSEQQQALLFSLEAQLVQADIVATKPPKQTQLKKEWFQTWQTAIAEHTTLITDVATLQAEFEREWHENSSATWLAALLLEVHDFKAYLPFSKETVKVYHGLHYSDSWLTAEFLPRLSFHQAIEYDQLSKTYERERHVLTNRGKKVGVSAAVTAGITVATAGVGYVFAPIIATALLGSSFAGLSGAALTSASLAAVGGGSLAAGGMGMAGGTALLAVGGGAVGLASGGIMSVSSLVLSDARTDTLTLMARLLTILSTIRDPADKRPILEQVKKNLTLMMQKLAHDTEMIQEAPANQISEKARKQQEKTSKQSLMYLRRAQAELDKMQAKLPAAPAN